MGLRMGRQKKNLLAHAPSRIDDFSRPYDLRKISHILLYGRKWSVKSYSTVRSVVSVQRAAAGAADFKKTTADIFPLTWIWYCSSERECEATDPFPISIFQCLFNFQFPMSISRQSRERELANFEAGRLDPFAGPEDKIKIFSRAATRGHSTCYLLTLKKMFTSIENQSAGAPSLPILTL
jgi:hypothetical protein